MDLNDYTLMLLLQDRQTEMIVAARRDALLREATRPRRPFRATLGTALIRLDAWLQAFWTVRAANAIAVTVTRASTLTQEGETMRGRLAVLIAAALLTLLPVNSPGVSEAAKRCTVADLNGTYVFAATGFGTPPGGSSPTAPKAIIEVISFNGDGTADTPKVR